MTRVSETHTINCNIKHETSRAILIQAETLEEGLQELWFPLSQVNEIHRRESISEGLFSDRIVCSKWIAQQKGVL